MEEEKVLVSYGFYITAYEESPNFAKKKIEKAKNIIQNKIKCAYKKSNFFIRIKKK